MTRKAGIIRLGVIGCGAVSETHHLRALQHVPAIKVTALADIDPIRLELLGARFGISERFADYRELIESENVDAVAVCTPPALHAELALAAIASGKHVFVEKPLALTSAEADLLSQAEADATKLKLMVGFNLRWHRLIVEARDKINRGELGRIKLVRTVFTNGARVSAECAEWRKQLASGGGVLFDLAVHHFDVIRFICGAEFDEIYSANVNDDETARVAARLANGAEVTSVFSQTLADHQEIDFHGERGRLRVSCYGSPGLEQFHAGEYSGSVRSRLRTLKRRCLELPQRIYRAKQGGDYVATYAAGWRHFAEAIIGDKAVACTFEDGRRALATCLAAVRANETQQPVRVEEIFSVSGKQLPVSSLTDHRPLLTAYN